MKRPSILCFIFSIVFMIVAIAFLYASYIAEYHDSEKLTTLLAQVAWTTGGISITTFFAALLIADVD